MIGFIALGATELLAGGVGVSYSREPGNDQTPESRKAFLYLSVLCIIEGVVAVLTAAFAPVGVLVVGLLGNIFILIFGVLSAIRPMLPPVRLPRRAAATATGIALVSFLLITCAFVDLEHQRSVDAATDGTTTKTTSSKATTGRTEARTTEDWRDHCGLFKLSPQEFGIVMSEPTEGGKIAVCETLKSVGSAFSKIK
jgi:hypothetical protein